MIIQSLGLGAIKIKNQGQIILIDPATDDIYSKKWRLKPDILLVSRVNQPIKNIIGDPFIIQSPGEYQKNDILIYGIQTTSKQDQSVIPYYLEIEEMNILHLGAIKDMLTEKQINELGDIDVLFVPVGGNFVLDDEKAAKIIAEIEPEIVVPIYYQIPGLQQKLNSIDQFCEEMGIKKRSIDKLVVKKKDLNKEETKIIILKAG